MHACWAPSKDDHLCQWLGRGHLGALRLGGFCDTQEAEVAAVYAMLGSDCLDTEDVWG